MDCVEGLKKMESNTAQIIICDCPYNIGTDFDNNSDRV
jgi:DNA modification methylase